MFPCLAIRPLSIEQFGVFGDAFIEGMRVGRNKTDKESGQRNKVTIAGGRGKYCTSHWSSPGAAGINILGFCTEFNTKTKDQKGMILPVVISVCADKTLGFILQSSPAEVLLKKMFWHGKGIRNSKS
jgi:ribosomal protein L11